MNNIQKLIEKASKASLNAKACIESLEAVRTKHSLTQGEMAGILGMNQSHYSCFVHGKRLLPRDAMRRAVAIGVPVKDVIS